MFTRIEVKDRKEAAAIERALAMPDVRAFVVVCGVLDRLPSDRSRARVLTYVADKLRDKDADMAGRYDTTPSSS